MKSLISFVLVICFWIFPVYAYDYTANESAYDTVILRLQQYGIHNSIKDEYEFGYKANRRDCLKLLYNTVLHMTNYNGLEYKVTDSELIKFALSYNILSKTEVERFDLDELIPWKESITITERMLVSSAGFNSIYPESFVSEEWFEFAEQNLIFGLDKSNHSGVYIDLSEKDEPTDIYKYFVILNSVIHTPYINETGDYSHSLVGNFYGIDNQPSKLVETLLANSGYSVPSGYLTRKEALYCLYSTSDKMIKDNALVSEIETKSDFVDFPNNLEDAYLVSNAIRENVLFGKISHDGELYLALNETITWKEALVFLERYYLQRCYHSDIEFVRSFFLNETNSWYKQGMKLGIIDNDFFARGIRLNEGEKDEYVKAEKYFNCLYSAVHLPTQYGDYSPMFSGYRLDLLCK